MSYRSAEFSDLVGKTLTKIHNNNDDILTFTTTEGAVYRMMHHQDCCESVSIEDIIGDLSDLEGTPILEAREDSGDLPPKDDYDDCYDWTFYNIRTIKGSVTIRWYGTSNGYYSTKADFEVLHNG